VTLNTSYSDTMCHADLPLKTWDLTLETSRALRLRLQISLSTSLITGSCLYYRKIYHALIERNSWEVQRPNIRLSGKPRVAPGPLITDFVRQVSTPPPTIICTDYIAPFYLFAPAPFEKLWKITEWKLTKSYTKVSNVRWTETIDSTIWRYFERQKAMCSVVQCCVFLEF